MHLAFIALIQLRQHSRTKIMMSKTVTLNDRDFIIHMLYKDRY